MRNKIDKTGRPPGAIGAAEAELAVSAKTGAGLEALRVRLKDCAGFAPSETGSFSARRRHLEAIERARVHIDEGLEQLTFRQGELAAEELRHAQQALAEITGEFSSDDLLGRIFSSFCIGSNRGARRHSPPFSVSTAHPRSASRFAPAAQTPLLVNPHRWTLHFKKPLKLTRGWIMAWDIDSAAHLLRRAGFGGSMAQVHQLRSRTRGRDYYLLNYESIRRPPRTSIRWVWTLQALRRRRLDAVSLIGWCPPLQEKLTWFGTDTTSSVVDVPAQLMVIKTRLGARTPTEIFFLKAMYKDPAMLDYLDNRLNSLQPNENFSRELMELFTIGIGNYTETDVKEAARA